MPVGEIIAEIGVRLVFEILFYGIGYYSGFCILKILTLGIIQLAPFSTIEERNKNRKIDWSIYLHRNGRRMIKPEVTALVGIIFLIGLCCILFISLK